MTRNVTYKLELHTEQQNWMAEDLEKAVFGLVPLRPKVNDLGDILIALKLAEAVYRQFLNDAGIHFPNEASIDEYIKNFCQQEGILKLS